MHLQLAGVLPRHIEKIKKAFFIHIAKYKKEISKIFLKNKKGYRVLKIFKKAKKGLTKIRECDIL